MSHLYRSLKNLVVMSKKFEVVKRNIISIVNGPAQFDLSTSLLGNQFVEITTQPQTGGMKITRKVKFMGLLPEDGSGHKWLIYLYDKTFQKKFHGYYDHKRRTGWIEECESVWFKVNK